MDLIPQLGAVFSAEGLALWAAAIVLLIQFGKRFVPFIPEHGRGVLYAVAVISLLVIAGAVWEAGTGIEGPNHVVRLLFTFVALSSAAIGEYEAGAKTIRVLTSSTNPAGPDR